MGGDPESSWPELERRNDGWEGPTPLAECREFMEAFRWRLGVAEPDRCLSDGLREGARWLGDGDGDVCREGGFRGAVDDFLDKGEIGS